MVENKQKIKHQGDWRDRTRGTMPALHAADLAAHLVSGALSGVIPGLGVRL